MSYADIRFQRIEENINELKESIKFLSDIMHDHLLDKDKEKNNDKNDNEKNNKKVSDKNNEKNGSHLMGLMEWVKSPSTILYGTSIMIGSFASYGLYHFYDKK
jgi:hypothetical protein